MTHERFEHGSVGPTNESGSTTVTGAVRPFWQRRSTRMKQLRPTIATLAAITILVAACGTPVASPGMASPSAASPSAASPSAAGGVNEKAKSATFPWGTFTLAQRIVDKAANGEALNIIVDNQGTGIPVFGAQQRIGTERGCTENTGRLAITCRLTGPATTDQTAQLAELETLLTSGQVDCLGVQSIVPDAYVDIINKYVDAGIPVFTQNTDVANSKRFAFFALNERDAGVANGKATADLVTAKGFAVTEIAMGSGGPEAPWAQDRMGGFAEGYKSVISDAKFFNDEKTGIPTGPGYTTQEVIDSVGPFLTGNPNVNFFFHTDQGVEGVATVIQNQGKNGKAWSSGFNVSDAILNGIDAGDILVTIDQGFDNQAEAAVTACVDFFVDGAVPPDPLAYLDPIIITKDGGTGQITATQARDRLKEATGG
jgi:ribose transport system substrate-binding protein